jgi:hypothetical protein
VRKLVAEQPDITLAESGLVFPGSQGRPITLETIIESIWHPAQVAAGVVAKDGTPKYSGLHTPLEPQNGQLMPKHRVLSFKPQLRLEWRGHDGDNETEQPNHSASLERFPKRLNRGIPMARRI